MENDAMDGSLWSCLPEDLIERVLARLPAANLLRLRTVCRKWSKLMATKSFLEACSQVASYKPYFVKMSINQQGWSLLSFDPSINRWSNMPISYLAPEVGFWPFWPLLVSSSGGLICFISNLHAHRSDGPVLYMSNPLTKTWKKLPRFLCKRQPMLVSMIMWKRPSHYKVIVAGEAGSTEIYDSVEGEWRNTASVPGGENVSRNVAFCNGSLYCLTGCPLNTILLAFSIQEKVWSKVKTGRLPGQRQFRNLVTCKGHLVIVGKSERKQVLSVCVWLLEWKTMKWREKWRMPQYTSDRFFWFPSERFSCSSHGDLIFLNTSECYMALLFDLAQNKWAWVAGKRDFNSCFSFEPRLDSQV